MLMVQFDSYDELLVGNKLHDDHHLNHYFNNK